MYINTNVFTFVPQCNVKMTLPSPKMRRTDRKLDNCKSMMKGTRSNLGNCSVSFLSQFDHC